MSRFSPSAITIVAVAGAGVGLMAFGTSDPNPKDVIGPNPKLPPQSQYLLPPMVALTLPPDTIVFSSSDVFV
jgi:hypothetical protein